MARAELEDKWSLKMFGTLETNGSSSIIRNIRRSNRAAAPTEAHATAIEPQPKFCLRQKQN